MKRQRRHQGPVHQHRHQYHNGTSCMKAFVSLVLIIGSMNSFLLVRSLRHPRRRVTPAFLSLNNGWGGDGDGDGDGGNNRMLSSTFSSSTKKINSQHIMLKMTSGNDNDDDDTTNKMKQQQQRPATAIPFSASPWENRKSLLVGSLLEKATSRAIRTLSTNANNADIDTPNDIGDDGDGDGTGTGTSSNTNSNPTTVENVLDATIVRTSTILNTNGEYTHDENNDDKDDDEPSSSTTGVQDVIDASISRSSSILEQGSNNNNNNGNSKDEFNINEPPQKETRKSKSTSTSSTSTTTSTKQKQHQKNKRAYLGNPSVTPTALAHSLWQSTILPYQDTIIDATCGNGKDCLALARMLFPDSIDDDGDDEGINYENNANAKPQLIGIDIQARAVRNTKQSLLSSLPSDIYYNHVTLLEQSHEHLMDVPRDTSSVGLVCYNLGYLPGAPSLEDLETIDNYKDCQTQVKTTLNSITDASLLLRVGGLLSIMTYPASNVEESVVVEHFAEGLAMLTTRDPAGWRGYADGIPDYDDDGDGGRVRDLVTRAVGRVAEEGEKKQTWRVFVHKTLGRPLSPVLVTAMRIK